MIRNLKIKPSDDWVDYDLKITLKPCYKCNQMCWYCHEYDNSTPVWTEDQCDVVINKLKALPPRFKKIFIYFYGGEPTLSKNWEYLHYQLYEKLADRELFIQTQTNMSISIDRLRLFLDKSVNRPANHIIDICSSYHLDKQLVEQFGEKMLLCNEFDCCGLCFFSTEIEREEQMIREFEYLLKLFPGKIKLKFTQYANLKKLNSDRYNELLEDEYLLGDDNGEQLEYRYFMRKYPKWEEYLEPGWDFIVNDSETINYSELMNRGIHYKLKYMHCKAGSKNLVINHDLKVYRCNDYFYQNIGGVDITDVCFDNFLSCDVVCLNKICTDGLDHEKYR